MYRVIVLDFDGVIVESNHIKNNAFHELFSHYPDQYDHMMKFHYAHNHMSRYDKFAYLYEKYFKVSHGKDLIAHWTHEFARLTRAAIVGCPFVAGALEFIDYFKARVPLYIASATPLSELEITLRERNLINKFTGYYGNPMNKLEIFREIAKVEGVENTDLVFVGDSIDDLNIADKYGCPFIGRYSNYRFDKDVLCFDDLTGIKGYLISRVGKDGIHRQII